MRLLLAKFEAEPLKCWIWKLLKGQIAYEPAFLAKAVAKAEWHLQEWISVRTPEQIAKAMKHPSVLAEAKRRIEAVREVVSQKK